jgi:EF-P beta-lysylation protein EpmB
LCRLLGLPAILADQGQAASTEFPLRVPCEYLDRIRPGDPQDPLLLQVLPRAEEQRPAEGFTSDPVGEAHGSCDGAVLKKYQGRALLITTGECAVHCRFCFRRHFPFAATSDGSTPWDAALQRIAADPTIREVILSGGDPLTLDDEELDALARGLAQIAHVQRLRIHSRMPIVIPHRVTDELLAWLQATRLKPVLVVHANHPAELSPEVAAALTRLADAGVPLFCQSVLLAGVNDRAEVLEELYRRLIDLRVTPYYLHQLDRVAGAAHFEVPESQGRRLIEALRGRLPGYAVPRYVREIPGRPGKVVIA